VIVLVATKPLQTLRAFQVWVAKKLKGGAHIDAMLHK